MAGLSIKGRVFYFGCEHGYGHRMACRPHANGQDEQLALSHFVDSNPWGPKVDAGLCPPGPQTEGVTRLHHKDGWTALAFWDRSVDHREGSNSVFLVWGTLTVGGVLQQARAAFPKVFARFRFPVTVDDAQLASIQGG